VNRFYGDGLNKLEPKDVEEMPCPVMPKLNQAEAREIIKTLVDLESLGTSERTVRLDKIAAQYFKVKPDH